MKILEPRTPEDFRKYYYLRWEILRKPWHQLPGTERDSIEEQCYHAMLCNDVGEALVVCRLQLNTPTEGQLRYMAVAGNMQGKGLGRQILQYLEEKARQLGVLKMVLDARENAVRFYEKNGYAVIARGYLLYGEIQHYKMEKVL